jgi:pimeloyl-ACP methyl ester carboxylesterase
MSTMIRVPSSHGVQVALHDFGGHGRTLLLSHATGFHGHCYVPIASALTTEAHSYALDYRGHGLTDTAPDWETDWEAYGDDVTVVAEHLRAASDQPLVGFGHSMGGAGLLMAAYRNPDLFDVILAFEPIVFPPPESDAPVTDPHASPLVQGASRRRARFGSYEEAIANFSAKPPMRTFTPEAVRLYVEHGFAPDPDDPDGGVVLRCAPEHEARTYMGGGMHRTWEVLPEITTKVVILAGIADMPGPATLAPQIAERLPNVEYLQSDEWDHFGPMVKPEVMAAVIRRHL